MTTPTTGAVLPEDDPAFGVLVSLYATDSWRQRIVEQVTPTSADHYRVTTSVQISLGPEIFSSEAPDLPGSLLVPVTWLTKQPLLAFGFANAAGTALTVMPRNENAGVTARVLHHLQSRVDAVGLDLDTLKAVAAASPDLWNQMRQRVEIGDGDAICDYLNLGTGHRLPPTEAARLLSDGRKATAIAYRATGVSGWWPEGALDNPASNGALLAAYVDPEGDNADLLKWVDDHHERIRILSRLAEEDNQARGYLRLLLRAGIRWPVVTDMQPVPGAVTLFKLTEMRPSGSARSREFTFETDVSVAGSYHLQVHSPDPSVKIRRVRAFTAPEVQAGFPETFEGVRFTDELWTAYTTDDTIDLTRFELRFGLRGDVWVAYLFALFTSLGAIVATLWLSVMTPDLAAVLTIPTSVAAGFALGREPRVVARYVLWHRSLVTLFAAVVWVSVLWRLVASG